MNIKNRNALLIFFFIFSVMASFEAIYLFFQNESFDAALFVFVYVVCFIILELLLLLVLSYTSQLLFFSAIALVLSANLFFLKLLFFILFQGLSDLSIIILIGVFGLIIYLIADFNKYPGLRLYFITGIIFLFVPVVSPLLGSNNDYDNGKKKSAPVLAQWGNIKFRETPNIHLISFDSMIPEKISREYMNVQDLPYTQTIDANMVKKTFSFSPRVATKKSLNSIMNLDQATMPGDLNYFSGRKPSILTSIAANNDYEITTGYSNYFFGKKGPYIDNYEVYLGHLLKHTVLCLGSGTSLIMQTRLFAVCNFLGEYFSIGHVFRDNININRDWPTEVLRSIRKLSRKTRPQLSLHYIYTPIGHTPLDYQHINANQREEYREFFLEGATKLDKILRSLITQIKTQDPKSIVIIFGDHGAYLSRGVSTSDNPEFVYLDRHAIELAVLKTEHQCTSEKIFYYSPSFATPSRVLMAVFRCLSKDPQSVDKLVNFIDGKVMCDTLDPSEHHMIQLITAQDENNGTCYVTNVREK